MVMEIEGLDAIEIENTSIDDIDSENVNLIFVGIDKSGSMFPYKDDMRACLKDFKAALEGSKEADEMLIARADFSNDVSVGGYKKVCDFDTDFNAGGCTVLHDVIVEGTDKLLKYLAFLKDQGMRVKAVFAIFSDGINEGSIRSAHEAKNSVSKLNEVEVTTAFISFGGTAAGTANDLGFRNVKSVGSTVSELRKAFNCLSKSVIESSKSVVADGEDFFQM